MNKFNCTACGQCCSNIQGIADTDKEFMKEYGYGKLPLIQLHPIEETTFPLWDYEAKLFQKYAEELNIDAKIRPSRGVFDLTTNRLIIVTYHMDSKACPFLKNNKCLIHEKKRAFICYSFPFNKSPFFPNSEVVFGECPELIKSQNTKELHNTYGDSFLAAIQHDFVMEFTNKKILELTKEKIIRPAMNYPYDKLLKRIENSNKIDFFDFIDKKELIERFQNFEDAREKIKSQ